MSGITTDTGWLAPNGRFYPCEYGDHLREAGIIAAVLLLPRVGGISSDEQLEELGWMKLADKRGPFLGGQREPTKRQNKALLEWCMGDGKGKTELPWWLEIDAWSAKVATPVRTSPGQKRRPMSAPEQPGRFPRRHRGREIVTIDGAWSYADTGEPVAADPYGECGRCGKRPFRDGHEDYDACLGVLSGAMNACCGHGVERDAFVQYASGESVHGRDALAVQRQLLQRRGAVRA